VITLQQAVPIAHFEGRCALSAMAIGDGFPSKDGADIVAEYIIGIARLVVNGKLVGWIYRTQHGTYWAQALPAMSKADQVAAGITTFDHGENDFQGPHARPMWYSGLSQIHSIPWPDVDVQRCDSGSTLP
jgi:hypothetical protein